MGEVYRARDTRLNRDVAIKILPEAFAEDPERLARFQREAQVLASLNHPHIAHIHGLEEAGTGRALVLELVEGETLADRIAQGPFPLEEALEIARQIALALEAAHARGIVHRDLKPANVKLTPEGTVKVLDFGLAKALTGDASSPEVTHSPTLTAAATQAGVVIGTAAYMSPEQARGRSVDRRADIWAFGAVLYEMLSGRKAFEGETVSDTLAAVLKTDPDWSRLPSTTPVNVRKVLKKCLERDREKRLHDIADARIELDEKAEAPAATIAAPTRRGPAAWVPWVVALLALAGLVFALTTGGKPVPASAGGVVRAAIPDPKSAEVTFQGPFSGSLAVSPDGRFVVFSAIDKDGSLDLWLRRLDREAAEQIPGTAGAQYPFWSPDSRHIAFFSGARLRRVPAAGGPVVEICETSREPRGGTWSPQGVIVFASHWRAGLSRVSAEGGKAEILTTVNEKRRETTHRFPHFLPDGKRYLYLAGSHLASDTSGENAIYLGSLDSSERTLVVNARSNVVYASGHLLFVVGRSLVAQPFDLARVRLTGEPTVLTDRLLYESGFFQGVFSASNEGLLVYQTGSATGSQFRLSWFDRSGKSLGAVGDLGIIFDVRLSPDGKRAAVSRGDPGDIWVRDLERGVETRVTFHPLNETLPVWTPDGNSLIFSSDRDVYWDVYRTDLRSGSGGSAEQPVFKAEGQQGATDISPDGKFLIIEQSTAQEDDDLLVVPLEGGGKPDRFVTGPYRQWDGHFSPNGRWVAYVSDESGRNEIYVTSYPRPEGKWQISSSGGEGPRWRGDGRELYYASADGRLMAVALAEDDGLKIGGTTALFPSRIGAGPSPYYDVTADGKKFLISELLKVEDREPLTLVIGWPALVKKAGPP
jgi:Tol biopolymer transport system component